VTLDEAVSPVDEVFAVGTLSAAYTLCSSAISTKAWSAVAGNSVRKSDRFIHSPERVGSVLGLDSSAASYRLQRTVARIRPTAFLVQIARTARFHDLLHPASVCSRSIFKNVH
jgi:hypothetical protein